MVVLDCVEFLNPFRWLREWCQWFGVKRSAREYVLRGTAAQYSVLGVPELKPILHTLKPFQRNKEPHVKMPATAA